MGYQVGNRCFDTRQQADDVYFSQVVPLVVPGRDKLVAPVYHESDRIWTMSGVSVSGTYPDCSRLDNFNAGLFLGGQIVLVLCVAFGFRVLARFIMRMHRSDPREF